MPSLCPSSRQPLFHQLLQKRSSLCDLPRTAHSRQWLKTRTWRPLPNYSFAVGLDELSRKIVRKGLSYEAECSVASSNATTIGLEELLAHVQAASGILSLPATSILRIRGRQELMEMEGSWEYVFAADGAFAEAFVASELSCITGFDGKGTAWEADAAGRVSQLDLDDYEVCLLSSWLRTGFWAAPAALSSLVIRHLDDADRNFLEQMTVHWIADDPVVAISLRGCKAALYVAISRANWLPSSAVLRAYGTAAVLTLDQWRPLTPSVPLQLPMETCTMRDSGDRVHTMTLECCLLQGGPPPSSISTLAAEAASTSIYPRARLFSPSNVDSIPVPLPGCQTASLDPNAPAVIEAMSTSSGHLLVHPLINGKDVGYFILDTGASTFTLEPTVADKLGLRKFGRVHTVTVNGPSQCSFREASSFTLGPLTIVNPRFVDVSGAALAAAGLPVVGICGYDVFRHCRVHLIRSKAPRSRKVTLRLLDPLAEFREEEWVSKGQKLTWVPIRMVSSTPNVTLSFRVTKGSEGKGGMFLLDTGAAGADVIFNPTATGEFGLWPEKASGGGRMKGMGTGTSSQSPAVPLADATFHEVCLEGGVVVSPARAVLMSPQQRGLELSVYGCGLICQNLLRDFDVIFDYKQQRVGLISSMGQQNAVRSTAQGG